MQPASQGHIATPEPSKKIGIQELAKTFDITPRAIRFYEDKGLISPTRESGSRVFGEIDIARLGRILRAKRLGFALDDIKIVMDVTDGMIADPKELRLRHDNFQAVIKSLKRRRKDIDVLTKEMTKLCLAIDTHLENSGGNENDVFYLAGAYQAAFGEEFADDDLVDAREE